MTNLEKYNSAFVEVFALKTQDLSEKLSTDSIDNWDSIRQLSLVTELETRFDVLFDPEDIFGLTSYDAGLEILRKYNIEI